MSTTADVLYRSTMKDTTPPPGSLGEAVDVFFDRVFSLLPVYVGRMPAIKMGLAAGAIVLFLAAPVVAFERRKATRLDAAPLERVAWLAYLVTALVVANMVQNTVTSVAYNSMMVSANMQHFANVHWAEKYVRAVRKPVPGPLG
jgi:hypothetical protein